MGDKVEGQPDKIMTHSEVEPLEVPPLSPGDKVRVWTKFKEGDEVRKQRFEGIVISRRGEGISETFTVRKVIGGCGVERIFPLHSPVIEKLDVIKRGKVRRAKLYYLRATSSRGTTSRKQK